MPAPVPEEVSIRSRKKGKKRRSQANTAEVEVNSKGRDEGSNKSSSSNGGFDATLVSAYAVYNNLVPGVKSYVDTSESTEVSKRKKRNKKKRASLKAENAAKDLLEKQTKDLSASEVIVGDGSSAAGKAKKRVTPTPASVLDNGSTEEVTTGNSNGKAKKRKLQDKPNHNKDQAATGKGQSDGQRAAGGLQAFAAKVNKVLRKTEQFNGTQVAEKSPTKSAKNAKKNRKSAPAATVTASTTETIELQQQRRKSTAATLANNKTNKSNGVEETGPQSPKKKNALGKRPKSREEYDDEEEDGMPSGIPPDVKTILKTKIVDDSVKQGRDLFSWLIHPQNVNVFMDQFWEKKALLVKRAVPFPDYYAQLEVGSAHLDSILRTNVLKYSKNVDVVYYENGERTTVSEDMSHRVRPAALWDYYSTGNSVRVLNPQTYFRQLNKLNAGLQEMCGTFVGANLYLTPPEAQGFAPHWDDIEAFVLQIEGKKRWKLYRPRNANETLPQFSSKDFGKEEDTLGEPFIDTVLEPGDLIYMPRGIIHQAHTVDGHHSLHVTISCYQQNCWADLLKHHFSKVMDQLASTDVEFRGGLPLDYLSYMGHAPSVKDDEDCRKKRKAFKLKVQKLLNKVGHVEADSAADAMGKKFMWDALPPSLSRQEKDRSVVDDGEFLINGAVKNRVEIEPDTTIKLIRKHCARLVIDPADGIRLYFSVENPLVYHEEEAQFVEIPKEFLDAVVCIINAYPEYIKIEDLPMPDNDLSKKLQIAADLWERGILMTEEPLEGDPPEDIDLDPLMDEHTAYLLRAAEEMEAEDGESDEASLDSMDEDVETETDTESDSDMDGWLVPDDEDEEEDGEEDEDD